MKKEFEVRKVINILCNIEDSSAKDSYVSVTEWANGSGFDVEIMEGDSENFSMTWEAWQVLKKIVKRLNKGEFDKEIKPDAHQP